MAVKGNILVGMGGFAVTSSMAILLDLFRQLDVRVNGIEVVVEWLDVAVVYGNENVVGFPQPEENDIAGTGGIVASGILGKGFSLKILHEDVRERAAGGFAHAKSLELPIEIAPPSEVGQVEIKFDHGQDVVDSAFVKIHVACPVFPGQVPSRCIVTLQQQSNFHLN